MLWLIGGSGRRYGLVGPNGSGKSTLLKALGNREVPIPEHIDIYFLDREIPASDMTALEVRASSPAVDVEPLHPAHCLLLSGGCMSAGWHAPHSGSSHEHSATCSRHLSGCSSGAVWVLLHA